ncbi:hypothetical protein LAV73_12315 [Lysinibacillus xylanilyticus]|uniref:hypothetical protein n=1 Tax=Lysinibacillus xylanilyticus TaxID=582475 RepID=UPI002B2426FE|nr:hypothetical protein [Lysinibacillus xylanilyticus]MEB2280779.1 hypothetical protein [Lysinibacillus xylanilyticus]
MTCLIRRFGKSIRRSIFIPSLRRFNPSLGQFNPSFWQIYPSFHFHTVALSFQSVTWLV